MPAPPTALGAIIVAFDNSPAAADVTNGLGAWTGQIPEQLSDQKLPLVCLVHEAEVPHYNTEVGYMEVTRFHFEVYNTLAAAEATALKIKTAYDKPATSDAMAAFSVANARVLQCWRPDGQSCYKVDPMPDRTSDGKVIFRVMIIYEMTLSRSL